MPIIRADGAPTSLEHIDGVICDFDGPILPYPKDGSHHALCADICIELATERLGRKAREEIRRLYFETGNGKFWGVLRPYRLCQDEFLKVVQLDPVPFLEQFHKRLFVRTLSDPDLFPDSPEIERALERLEGQVRFMILSHASRPDWIEPALERMKISARFFDAVLGMDELEYRYWKDLGPVAVQRALSILKLPAHRVGMVEDSGINMRFPKRLGVTTCWMCRGWAPPHPPGVLPSSADMYAPSLDVLANRIADDKARALRSLHPEIRDPRLTDPLSFLPTFALGGQS